MHFFDQIDFVSSIKDDIVRPSGRAEKSWSITDVFAELSTETPPNQQLMRAISGYHDQDGDFIKSNFDEVKRCVLEPEL